jgi:hypothetical protein
MPLFHRFFILAFIMAQSVVEEIPPPIDPVVCEPDEWSWALLLPWAGD